VHNKVNNYLPAIMWENSGLSLHAPRNHILSNRAYNASTRTFTMA